MTTNGNTTTAPTTGPSSGDALDRKKIAEQAAKLEAMAAELRAQIEAGGIADNGSAAATVVPQAQVVEPAAPVVAKTPVASKRPAVQALPLAEPAFPFAAAAVPQAPEAKGVVSDDVFVPRVAEPKAPAAPVRAPLGKQKPVPVPSKAIPIGSDGRPKPVPMNAALGETPLIRKTPTKEDPAEDENPTTRLIAQFKAFRRRFGRATSVSLVMHVVLVLALGLYAIKTVAPHREATLVAAPDADTDEPMKEMPEVTVQPDSSQVESPPVVAAAPSPTIADVAMVQPNVAGEKMDIAVGNVTSGFDGLSGVSNGDALVGLPEKAPPGPPAPPKKPQVGTAKFFGAARKGNKFVYVIDNSGSMRGALFDRARAELMNSVAQMTRYQSFYVIFYSDKVYPMFDPNVEKALVPAEDQNKAKLLAWMQTQEVHGGGKVVDAMKLAMDLKPDAIFLLSDGKMSDYPRDYLLGLDSQNVSINTICFGTDSVEGATLLKAVADKHDGIFQFVP